MRALSRFLGLYGFTFAAFLFLIPASGGHLPSARVVFASQESPPPDSLVTQPSAQTNPPTGYTLSPEKRAKAIAYAHARYIIYFSGVALSLGTYFFLWRARISLAFRNWARQVSPAPFCSVPRFRTALFCHRQPDRFPAGILFRFCAGTALRTIDPKHRLVAGRLGQRPGHYNCHWRCRCLAALLGNPA